MWCVMHRLLSLRKELEEAKKSAAPENDDKGFSRDGRCQTGWTMLAPTCVVP